MSDKMQSSEQQLSESLSALMDGEVNELELRRLLKADPSELNARWMRYHVARDTIKNELNGLQANEFMDLSASISDAIAAEPALNEAEPVIEQAAGKAKSTHSWWSNMGRFAVAASVAGAVVVGVQFSPTGSKQLADTSPAAPINTVAPSGLNNSPALSGDTSVRVVGNQPRQQERAPIVLNQETQAQLQQMESEINRWMSEHAQNASQNTQQGLLPYVRVPEAEQQ